MKDVQGKCIPKTRRGRLSGLATTIGGTATVVLTALLFWDRGDPGIAFYSLLLLLAALLWVIAGALFAGVEEYAGETGGGGNALSEAFSSLSLLRDDAPFRHFVITRALLLCSGPGPHPTLLCWPSANPMSAGCSGCSCSPAAWPVRSVPVSGAGQQTLPAVG